MPPVIGGRRRRLKSISEYLISSNKPALEPVQVVQSARPTKWEIRKKALAEQFAFLNYFKFSMKRKNYVTPAEALQSDPQELMTKLRFTAMIDDNKLAAANAASQHNGESVAESSNLDSVVDESIAFSGSVGGTRQPGANRSKSFNNAGESVDGSVLKSVVRHGYGGANKRMEVGDILPTGKLFVNTGTFHL